MIDDDISDTIIKILSLYDPKKLGVFQIFLYQQFIHNVILGKPKITAQAEHEEWFKKSRDEKRALRLIAFMKNNDDLVCRCGL